MIRPIDGPALCRQIGIAMLRSLVTDSANHLLTELTADAERIRSKYDSSTAE